ncbi:MAG: NADH-quinone oxidoreductase subunit J [Candidatus Methanomethylicia archaeon]
MYIEILELTTFIFTSILAILSAIMIVKTKSLIYSALFLGMLGISMAIFFALMGYQLVSLFQIIVYVGATVTFIIFSIVMLRETYVMELSSKILSISIATLILLIFTAIVSYTVGMYPTTPIDVPYDKVAELLMKNYTLPLIIVIFALITTLIEGIIIAKKEVEK